MCPKTFFFLCYRGMKVSAQETPLFIKQNIVDDLKSVIPEDIFTKMVVVVDGTYTVHPAIANGNNEYMLSVLEESAKQTYKAASTKLWCMVAISLLIIGLSFLLTVYVNQIYSVGFFGAVLCFYFYMRFVDNIPKKDIFITQNALLYLMTYADNCRMYEYLTFYKQLHEQENNIHLEQLKLSDRIDTVEIYYKDLADRVYKKDFKEFMKHRNAVDAKIRSRKNVLYLHDDKIH